MAVFSAITGGRAARRAARAQERASERAIGTQREFLDLLRPGIEIGDEARETLAGALGLRGESAQRDFFTNFEDDPGFQRAVDFGTENILGQRAALGGLRSGGTLRAVQEFGQTAQLGAFQNRLGNLFRLAGGGQAALGQAGGAFGNISGLQQGIGQAQAGGIIGAQNALTGGVQNTLNLASFAAGGGFGGGGLFGGQGAFGGRAANPLARGGTLGFVGGSLF